MLVLVSIYSSNTSRSKRPVSQIYITSSGYSAHGTGVPETLNSAQDEHAKKPLLTHA